jgi:hypothetical protein
LTDIENRCYLRNEDAQQKLKQGIISEADYDQVLEKSKVIFYGD